MQIAYSCPECERPNWTEINSATREIGCAHCDRQAVVLPGAIEGEHVHRCLICPSTDLFVRKDFPQRLGVLIVTVGLLASCVAWAYAQLYLTFAILFATALIDVVLYVVVPNALMCYRCGAMYRGTVEIEQHGAFNLETHERHRQQRIRLAEAQRTAAAQNS